MFRGKNTRLTKHLLEQIAWDRFFDDASMIPNMVVHSPRFGGNVFSWEIREACPYCLTLYISNKAILCQWLLTLNGRSIWRKEYVYFYAWRRTRMSQFLNTIPPLYYSVNSLNMALLLQ